MTKQHIGTAVEKGEKMKGYIDNEGHDRPACVTCKNKHKLTVEAPCYNCIDLIDLVLHKPNCETNFANYEKEEKEGAAND